MLLGHLIFLHFIQLYSTYIFFIYCLYYNFFMLVNHLEYVELFVVECLLHCCICNS